MRWLARRFANLFRPGGDVVLRVGNYPGVVVLTLDGRETLASPATARIIATRINEAADRAEQRAGTWFGVTAGRLPKGAA